MPKLNDTKGEVCLFEVNHAVVHGGPSKDRIILVIVYGRLLIQMIGNRKDVSGGIVGITVYGFKAAVVKYTITELYVNKL